MNIPANLIKHLDELGIKNLEKWLKGHQLFQGWHGSPTAGFESFDLGRAGSLTHAADANKYPIVLTSSPLVAADYSLGRDAVERLGGAEYAKELVRRANAANDAPFVQGGPSNIEGIYPLIAKGKNVREIDAKGQKYSHNFINPIVDKAYRDKVDMLIMRNFDDVLNSANLPSSDVAYILNPSQVKSLNNYGEFAKTGKNKYNFMHSAAPVGIGVGTLAAAGMLPDSEASAKSAYINSPEMKAAMMGIRDEPVKDAWNPVEALATAPIGAFTTGARAASVGIDALLSALLGD